MRHKYIFTRSCCIYLAAMLMLTGCKVSEDNAQLSVAKQSEIAMHLGGVSQSEVQASIPEGMRIGQPYFSALGENCYEVFSLNFQDLPVHAMCMRNNSWILISPVHMVTPKEAVN